MNLGEKIKQSRIEQCMSQKELGDLVGVTQTAISQLETGSRGISHKTIEKIFEVLEMEVK